MAAGKRIIQLVRKCVERSSYSSPLSAHNNEMLQWDRTLFISYGSNLKQKVPRIVISLCFSEIEKLQNDINNMRSELRKFRVEGPIGKQQSMV